MEIHQQLTLETDTRPPKLLYKNTKWKAFTKHLNEQYQLEISDDRNLTKTEIEEYLKKINQHILNAIENKIPKLEKQDSPNHYITNRIKKLLKFKSILLTRIHAQKKANHQYDTAPINYLKQLLAEIKNKIKEEIKKNIESHWTKIAKKIDYRNSDKFFPIINKVFRPRSWQDMPNIHIKTTNATIINRSQCNKAHAIELDDEYIIEDTKDKLNVIGAYYETINSPRYLNTNTRLKEIVDQTVNEFITKYNEDRQKNKTTTTFSTINKAYTPNTEPDTPKYFCSIAEVHMILKKLPNKTSTGLDNIPAIVLKHLTPRIIKDYTVIFNNALNNKYFPESWKTAKTIPIYKKGKPLNHPASYRPISLTPNISKVYEAVIRNSIQAHCKNEKIIPNNQFGFRHQHSTVHAIHKLLSDVNLHLLKKEIIAATLIDLEKAFDSVWIFGLIFILIRRKFPTMLVEMIWNMITDRKYIIWDGMNM
ncbi:uncharacterized protein LOC128668658 [Microplitis demolitor]|uniref:uncharacterized protein LOC128668658 n=1 Tax=Microplitis demolitor TaxID=69319 RepID=UPI00235B5C77|nr:uncharacterized protein LOC128668658 [Microplitis demolitor]